jgi:hypothetical protein
MMVWVSELPGKIGCDHGDGVDHCAQSYHLALWSSLRFFGSSVILDATIIFDSSVISPAAGTYHFATDFSLKEPASCAYPCFVTVFKSFSSETVIT